MNQVGSYNMSRGKEKIKQKILKETVKDNEDIIKVNYLESKEEDEAATNDGGKEAIIVKRDVSLQNMNGQQNNEENAIVGTISNGAGDVR